MKKQFSPFQYCVNEVKTFNHDHFLYGLLIPSLEARKNFFTVRALNIELASVVDSSSGKSKDPSFARLVWWRSAIQSMFQGLNEVYHKNLLFSSSHNR